MIILSLLMFKNEQRKLKFQKMKLESQVYPIIKYKVLSI